MRPTLHYFCGCHSNHLKKVNIWNYIAITHNFLDYLMCFNVLPLYATYYKKEKTHNYYYKIHFINIVIVTMVTDFRYGRHFIIWLANSTFSFSTYMICKHAILYWRKLSTVSLNTFNSHQYISISFHRNKNISLLRAWFFSNICSIAL